MMISEKMVFTSSNGNHLVLYARPPAGISIQGCSVRSSFLLDEKGHFRVHHTPKMSSDSAFDRKINTYNQTAYYVTAFYKALLSICCQAAFIMP